MKRMLFTGASGFLGQNILPILKKSYLIETIGLTDNDDYKLNLASEIPSFKNGFDIVLHAAGKAHSFSNDEKEEFFKVNLQGTKNLCIALEKNKIPKAFIFISTVAVYGLEFGDEITEEYPLNGKTPYAVSKIQAEEFLKKWCVKNNVILGIIRPSLIAGKNPPGNLGAMINGIKTGKYLRIGNGIARKSILMAEDIPRIIPKLVKVGGIYNLCDNDHPTFAELEDLITNQLNKKSSFIVPYWFAKALALVGDLIGEKFPINSNRLSKIVSSLTFSNEKAKKELGWEPLSVIHNFRIK